MCLRIADLVLKWSNKDQYYIGKGYKGISKYSPDFDYGFQEWKEAVTEWGGEPLEKSFEYTDIKYKKYHPGFHIFLNKKDAISYNQYGIKNNNIQLVEVSFSDVLAFGTNVNHNINDGDGPCVVARWIRIDKILS